jgi:hypothetical protein
LLLMETQNEKGTVPFSMQNWMSVYTRKRAAELGTGLACFRRVGL